MFFTDPDPRTRNPRLWIRNWVVNSLRIRIRPIQFVAIEKKVVKKVVKAQSFFKYSIFLGLLDPDPLVRGGSGSESFYHQAKLVRKPLTYSLWLLYDLLSLKNYVNVLQKAKSRNSFFLASWGSLTKIAGSGSISRRHGSADPDRDRAKMSRIRNTYFKDLDTVFYGNRICGSVIQN